MMDKLSRLELILDIMLIIAIVLIGLGAAL